MNALKYDDRDVVITHTRILEWQLVRQYYYLLR